MAIQNLGGLLGSPFAAVADVMCPNSNAGYSLCHALDVRCSVLGEGTFRILGFCLGLSVLNEIEFHRRAPFPWALGRKWCRAFTSLPLCAVPL